MLLMLEVSHKSVDKADHPVPVILASSRSKRKVFNDLLPANPVANASKPASSIRMLLMSRYCKLQFTDWKTLPKALNPTAVMS
mmetsp:Transcript_19163/g.28408  ORF Transcript_19163/g.28408 Transcript_19163/m.28408 type:complete len:83 (+) Transcript_19163:2866-3114(+)